MGQIDPYQNEKTMGKCPYSRVDKMSARCSSIHSAKSHRLRPRRKSSRKEAEHSLRYGQGQERGDKWIRHLTVYGSVLYCNKHSKRGYARLPVFASAQRHFRDGSLISSEITTQEDKTIDNKKKEEVIRFKTTTDHKAKIERAAEKRGITVSEYLRQSVNAKLSRERPMDWYPTIERLEAICAGADGETREALIDLIRSLYKGGA